MKLTYIKKVLFRIFGLKVYLILLQKTYLLFYRIGILRLLKEYEWHCFIPQLIRTDDVIIDMGANIGYFSIVFNKCLGRDGQLYCVEPVPQYVSVLQSLLGKKKNVNILQVALGQSNQEEVTICVPNLGDELFRHGLAHVAEEPVGTSSKNYAFKSVLRNPMDLFHHLDRLNYIKCDIEGYEVIVLKEMEPLLQKFRPMVQVESWGNQLPVIIQFFGAISYTPYQLKRNKLRCATGICVEELASSDVLFVPAEKASHIT